MAVLSQFDYIFAIGTFFALLDAFNNGASKCLGPSVLGLHDTELYLRRRSQCMGNQCIFQVHLIQMGHGLCHGV